MSLLMEEDYCSVVMATGTVTIKLYNLAVMGAVMIVFGLESHIAMYAPSRGGGLKQVPSLMGNWACLLLSLVSNGLKHLGCPERTRNLTLTHHLINFI